MRLSIKAPECEICMTSAFVASPRLCLDLFEPKLVGCFFHFYLESIDFSFGAKLQLSSVTHGSSLVFSNFSLEATTSCLNLCLLPKLASTFQNDQLCRR